MIRRTACLIARGNDPCRNLAIEKHLMDTLPEGTAILYLFQNDHSVVIGRNQNPWYECAVDSFLEAGGHIVRRLSGGGAVYQDLGCLNYSLIVPKAEFDIRRQLEMIGSAAAALRVPVEPGPRATLLGAGRSFCSNAFFKAGSGAIQHGTLLLDADIASMERSLSPKRDETKKGEPSLRSQVVNLKELAPEATLDELEQLLCRYFTLHYRIEPAWLDEQMMDAYTLDRLAAQFGDPAWVYPEAADYNFTVSERFPWGSVSVLLLREGGVIRAAKIFSDAMEAALFSCLEQGLVGCPFLIGAITKRFEQKLALLRDTRLLQIAGDVCTLVCGKIRATDRGGGQE